MRVRSLLTAAAVILTIFASSSCSKTDGKTDVTTEMPQENGTSGDAAPTNYDLKTELGLPDGTNFGKFEVRMLLRNDEKWITDMYVEAVSGDVVDDAVYNRNMKVSELLGCEFVIKKSSNPNYETDALKTVLADTDEYDIIIPHARAAFTYANNGICLNWNDFSFTRLDQPWWDQDARTSFSVNNKLFVMVGDLSYLCAGATCAIVFNKKMMNNLGLDYPYAKVLSGDWTYEAFNEYARHGVNDLNGDGIFKVEDDSFGYTTWSYGGPIQLLYSAGQRILKKDTSDIPYIALDTPETISALEWFYGMAKEGTSYLFKELSIETLLSTLHPKDVFMAGRSLFYDVNICDIEYMRSLETDFGIVPWPKINKIADRYFSNVDAGTNLFVVPITQKNPDRISAVLEALSIEGYHNVVPQYLETALKTKYSRDEESRGMLDLIMAGRVYDLGYFNYDLIGEMGNGLISFLMDENLDFKSWYEKRETAANKTLQSTIAKYE